MERQGRKIGIVGLVNEETPSLASPCKEAVFGPAETALREAVASLRAQGVNIVIALTHLVLNVDCELAWMCSSAGIRIPCFPIQTPRPSGRIPL